MAGSNKTTSATTVPAYLQEAGQNTLNRATDVSRIGNVGYYGPDVAAMTPAQIAAMQGTNAAASAFGLNTFDPMAGMPTATNYGGMNAYSSGTGYEAALAELKARFPGQFEAIMSQFVDRVTGAMPGATGSGQTQMGMPTQGYAPVYGDRSGGGSGGGGYTGGGSGSGNFSMLRANLPGGINTNNPDSFINRTIGGLVNAIIPQREPTSNMRPPPSPPRPAGVTTSKVTTSKPAVSKSVTTRQSGR